MFCVSLGVFMYIYKYINIYVHIEEKWWNIVPDPNTWSQRLRKCWQFWSPLYDTQTKLEAMATKKESRDKLILNSKQSSQCWTLGCTIWLGRYSAEPKLIQQLCFCSLESQVSCFAAIHPELYSSHNCEPYMAVIFWFHQCLLKPGELKIKKKKEKENLKKG